MEMPYDLDAEVRLLRKSRDSNEIYQRTLQSLRYKEAEIMSVKDKIARAEFTLQNIQLEIAILKDSPFAGPPKQKYKQGSPLRALENEALQTLHLLHNKLHALMNRMEYREEKQAVEQGAAEYRFYQEKYRH